MSDISWVILSKIYFNYEELFSLRWSCKASTHVRYSVTNTNRLQYYNSIFTIWPTMPKADPAPAHRARASLYENVSGIIFEKFDCRTRINFIVITMQCLQCIFYFLLSLQKHKVCVKGHQNNLPRRDPPPPGS